MDSWAAVVEAAASSTLQAGSKQQRPERERASSSSGGQLVGGRQEPERAKRPLRRFLISRPSHQSHAPDSRIGPVGVHHGAQ